MAKIAFTQKAWLKDKSQKVETKSGFPAKILHCDGYGESPILVTVDLGDGGGMQTRLYFADGKLYKEESDADLFLVTPEPELTEWQESISACLQKHGLLDCGAADRIAKESAAELLELARKQLAEEQYTSDPRKSLLYKLGKAEALKDLPRWKKLPNGIMKQVNLFGKAIIVNNHYILYSDIEKLPKDE